MKRGIRLQGESSRPFEKSPRNFVPIQALGLRLRWQAGNEHPQVPE
jgi:hypothetical protein